MEETHWYYIDPRDKSQVGPLTLDEMKERYQDGRLSEETYAWHEDAEQWAKLRELRFNSRTLREIIAFSTAPGSRKITEQLETSERGDRAKSVVDELQKRMERLQEASEVDIEERIRVNRERTGTATTRLPARSVVVPQNLQAPESSPETSSDSVNSTQSSEGSEDEATFDWVERASPEGAPFFTNVRTGQRTDSRPEILEELVWLPDQKEGYTAARLLSGAKPAAQRIDNEEVVPISSEVAQELQRFYRGALSLELAVCFTQDLVQLKPIHESRILLILRNRLAQGKIYTRIGNVLINFVYMRLRLAEPACSL